MQLTRRHEDAKKGTRISFALVTLICCAFSVGAQDDYKPGPDSERHEGVPKGKVTTYTWESKIYPNTKRNYYVYIPAQYNPSIPAALMVFQDGHAYVKEDGDFRVPIVFDNLINKKEMPVTIGLFVDPGYWANSGAPENPFRSQNRSYEYDDVSDQYATFLITELIPELKKTYNISDDPKTHAICGLSSGGICAFTAAWFRPDYFHKVLSHIGSFTDIRGGHNYPALIRKSARKDIKVFLQDGNKDLNNNYGAAGWQLIDHIYTSIFISTLLVPVSINDWYLQGKFLYKRKYAGYFALLAINIVAGVFLNQYLFGKLIDFILPGYYFISYFEFIDLLEFFVVFVVLNMLISLSLEWFRLQELRFHQTQLQKEKVSAEFKALVAQVNPHFLFNSLTILYALAIKNSTETPGAILKLSEILRYVIQQSSAASVTLQSELTILRDFIDLQRYRVHPTTQVDLFETVTNQDIRIAPMLFLPLLENSFKHGIHEETNNAFVRAKISEQNGQVTFTIINNKSSQPNVEKGGFGLANLAERLRLIYPGKHKLDISETPTTFAVTMLVNLK